MMSATKCCALQLDVYCCRSSEKRAFFLGLPLASLGSGYVVARRSARPCSFFAALKNLGLRLRRTTFYPSARFNRAALAIVCYEFLARPAIF